MRPTQWARFPLVQIAEGGIELMGEPQWYELKRAEDRRDLTRDLLDACQEPGAAVFAHKWGAPVLRTPRKLRSTRDLPGSLDELLTRHVSLAEIRADASRLRKCREGGLSADEKERTLAQAVLLSLIRQAELVFAEVDALVPQLAPTRLNQVAAVTILEEIRGVGPYLQCMNYPSSGCQRVVPPRNGRSGRRPRYCSEKCAMRAQSARAYARRKARVAS